LPLFGRAFFFFCGSNLVPWSLDCSTLPSKSCRCLLWFCFPDGVFSTSSVFPPGRCKLFFAPIQVPNSASPSSTARGRRQSRPVNRTHRFLFCLSVCSPPPFSILSRTSRLVRLRCPLFSLLISPFGFFFCPPEIPPTDSPSLPGVELRHFLSRILGRSFF